MTSRQTDRLPTLIVVVTGIAWGIYWVPVRAMEAAGLSGAWGSFTIVMAAVAVLAPFALVAMRSAPMNPLSVFAVFIGGAGFMMYSVGYVYGRVSIIILLFFLTPVWSTLIARFVMGWATPRLRLYTIAVGLVGLMVMLSAGGTAPVPQNLGEWLALASGLIWSVSTTMMRVTPPLKPQVAAFIFAIGAASCAGLMAPFLSAFPWEVFEANAPRIAAIAFVTGACLWALTMVGLLWAAPLMDPARVGILLMAEVLIGTLTAAWFAGERISAVEMLGGSMVLLAGVLEVWPVKTAAKTAANSR